MIERVLLAILLAAAYDCASAQNEYFGDASPSVLVIHYWNDSGREVGVTKIFGLRRGECLQRIEELLEDKSGIASTMECVPLSSGVERRPTRPEVKL